MGAPVPKLESKRRTNKRKYKRKRRAKKGKLYEKKRKPGRNFRWKTVQQK